MVKSQNSDLQTEPSQTRLVYFCILMFGSLRVAKDLDFVEKFWTASHYYWVKRHRRLPWFGKGECLEVGTNTSTLVEICHPIGPRVIQANRNNISQTCTIYASWFVVDTTTTDPSTFWNKATTKLHRLYKDSISQQQWPWLTPSGPPVRHVSSITPPHRFHTALIFDKQNCNSLLMYIGCFCFTREMCETLWKSRDVLHCPSNTDLAIVFFLTREIKLVIIYCHDVKDDYDHLFTRCKRCSPACLCVHERRNDRTEDVMKIIMISGVAVLSTMLNVSCPWEIHWLRECLSSCVRLLWNPRWLQSQEPTGCQSDSLLLTEMCMKPLRAWLFGDCDI